MKAVAALATVLALTAVSGAWADTKPLRIDAVSPQVASRGALVTLHGSGFAKTLRASVGGKAAELVSAHGSKATVRVPEDAPVGEVLVEVRKPGGRTASAPLTVRFDGQVAPLVDEKAAVSAAVGAAGGVVEVSGMQLSIPAGAVPEGTTITATPLTRLTGSPFEAAPVGLKLEPSGLVLMQPATLSLPRPAGDLLVGFSFDGDGDDFHLVPHRSAGDTVQLKVWHFSGSGVLPARLAELQTALSYEPSPAHMLAEQRIAAALADAELNGTDPGSAIAAALRAWRLDSVLTGLEVARTSTQIAFFELAFGEWLAWLAYLQEYRDSLSTADAAGFDAAARVDRDTATVSAAAVARRALDDCTGPSLPLAALRKVVRIAVPVKLAELPIEDAADPGERPLPDGSSLAHGCVEVRIGAIDHAPVLARNRDNGFVAGGQVFFWSGPPSTSIPLRYRLGDSTDGPPVPLASDTVSGGFSTTIRPTALGVRALELTVDLGGDEALLTFFDRRTFDITVRERLELHARRAGDTAFTDTVPAVDPGDPVTLRVRLAGDHRNGKEIVLTHDGPGTLPPTATTNAAGEAIVTYIAPATSAVELVTASITDDGLTSGDATVITTETLVNVTISPTIATIASGGTRQFSATVTGTADPGVSWTATGGTVSADGLYTAGATAGTFSVTATSVADPSKSATATVQVTGPSASVTVNEVRSEVIASARACAGDALCDEERDRKFLAELGLFDDALVVDAISESPEGPFAGNKAVSIASAALSSRVDSTGERLDVVASGSADGDATLTLGDNAAVAAEYFGEASGRVNFTVTGSSLPFTIAGSGRATASAPFGRALFLLIRDSPFEVIRVSQFEAGGASPSAGGSFDTSGTLTPGTYSLGWGAACRADERRASASCDASFSFSFRLGP